MNSAKQIRTSPSPDGLYARGLNAVLGGWLFVSTFAWTHAAAQATNAQIVGLLAAASAAVAAFWIPKARYANTALAIWLGVTAFAFPSATNATIWNHGLVAILMFVFSFVANGAPRASVPRAA